MQYDAEIQHSYFISHRTNKIFCHLLDMMILNSFILSCKKVTSLHIMMKHYLSYITVNTTMIGMRNMCENNHIDVIILSSI
jgi:hypothetical protein